MDRLFHGWTSRFTLGISPASIMLANLDWLVHLTFSPGKQVELFQKALRKALRFNTYAARAISDPRTSPCLEPLTQDQRFSSAEWQRWPFNLIYQSFLLTQQWWYNATTEVQGVSRHHEDVVSFLARQILDLFAPSNFIPTNPQISKTTIEQRGNNLIRGTVNLYEDWERATLGRKSEGTEAFEVGKNVAITPGKVVYRNRLAKTGYTREAGRCIVVDVAMPRGPVIIALLGARSARARSADLATIRNWVNGDETPVAVPRLYYASAHSHHSHPGVASQPHRVKVRFASTGPSHRHASRRVIASRAGA